MSTESQYRYEMNLKKDALFINLTSDDVTFISRQMDQWFRILFDDSYIPTPSPGKRMDAPPIAAEAPAVPVASVPEPVQPPPMSEVALPFPAPAAPAPVSAPEPVQAVASPPVSTPAPEVAAAPAPPPVAVAPEPVPVAPAPPEIAPPQAPPVATPTPAPSGIETLVTTPAPVPEAAPLTPATPTAPAPAATTSTTTEPPQDSFDAVMDSVMRDLEINSGDTEKPFLIEEPISGVMDPEPVFSAPALAPIASIAPEPGPVAPAPQLPFSSPAPVVDPFASLADLCRYSRANEVQDFLLLSALYLNRSENAETFSLKRLNSALVKAGQSPANHSALEAALTRGVLAMVPDLSDSAEVSEYELTPAGLQTANELIAR